jgi:NADH-quinone oxidoreductase subunit M
MSDLLASIHFNQWILHALILLPLAGVVPVLLGYERSAKWMALVVTSIEFLLSVGLWWSFDPSDGGMQMVSSTPWIPRWGISYYLGLDGISLSRWTCSCFTSSSR